MILIVNKISEKFHGELKNTLLEIKHNVFVGSPSKRIREIMWSKVVKNAESAVMANSDKKHINKYEINIHGDTNIVEINGRYFSKL